MENTTITSHVNVDSPSVLVQQGRIFQTVSPGNVAGIILNKNQTFLFIYNNKKYKFFDYISEHTVHTLIVL
jgi:hypothetical protein